jgi:outer membrane protein OmpA-like peptidoglycan-associated protein
MRSSAKLFLTAIYLAAAATQLSAQDNSVKDLLNRAQSGSDKRAVEDLIKKLKDAPPPDPAPAGTPAPAPASSASTSPSAPADAQRPVDAQAPAAGAVSVGGSGSPPPTATAAPVTAPSTGGVVGASTPLPAGTPASTPPLPAPAATPPTPVSAPALPSAPTLPTAKPAEDVTARAPDIAKQKNLPTVDLEVFFDYDSAAITPQATAVLQTLGRALADPELAGKKFIIAGHTDGRGLADYNLDLSQRRAEAVRLFVIEHYKIDAANLAARGFGKQKLKNARRPLAAENRRVQIINWTTEAAGGNFR